MDDVGYLTKELSLVWKTGEGSPEEVTLGWRYEQGFGINLTKTAGKAPRQRKQYVQMPRGRSQR